jgi:hypothetical protein
MLYAFVGTTYGGLGVETIEAALAGSATIAGLAFLWKIVATSVTLESGGSGGIVTRLFFIAANTPIAAAVMGIELLPADVGVYAALAAGTSFLMVGHRSFYASQKIGLSKSAGLDLTMDGPIGDLTRSGLKVRRGSLTEKVTRLGSRRSAAKREED